MKKMKKIVSLLLTLVMVAAMAVSVSAADSYTITIDNSASGHVYEAYRIFSGTLTGTGTSSDPYVLTGIGWGSGIDSSKESDLMTALTALNAFSTCTTAADVANVLGSSTNNTTDSTVAQAFADVVSQYLSSSATGTSTESTGSYKITVTSPGYYLVKDKEDSLDGKDDAYTRFILEVVANVTAKPKSDKPSVEKKVYEESISGTDGGYGYGYGYNDVADYDIGDAVPFKLIGTMPSNLSDYDSYTYIFHDTMVSGLTFDSTSVVVTIGDKTVKSSNYSVITDTTSSDNCTFEVKFSNILSIVDTDDNPISVNKDSEVIVTYTATLNSNAEIGLDGNENEVYLEYSNNPNVGGSGDTGKTPVDKVIVFTYELDVTKTNGGSGANLEYLKGAKFKLYKTVGSEDYYATVDTDGKVTGWTTVVGDATELVSGDSGLFKVAGLDDGTYYLVETEAPTGYNLLSAPVTLVIEATTVNDQNWNGTPSAALTALTISVDNGTAENGTLNTGIVSATVENKAGSSLPETGGMGTTILYVIGTILVLGAAILLVTRRRMGSEK